MIKSVKYASSRSTANTTPDDQPTVPKGVRSNALLRKDETMNRTLVVLLVGVLAIVYVGLHLTSYVPVDHLPNDDYANVLGALTILDHPEAFTDDRLASLLVNRHTRTAPIYYYGLAVPLSQLVHPSTAIKLLGVALSLLLGVAAGLPWRRPGDGVRGVLVFVVFLHLSFTVNPLLGHERSFAAVILAAYLWLEDHGERRGLLLLLALATGIYPPAALVVLAALGFGALNRGRRQDGFWPELGFVLLAAGVFLLVLSPYLASLANPAATSARASNWVQPLHPGGEGPGGWLHRYVHGPSRGTLFAGTAEFGLFCVFVVLAGLQRLVVGPAWRLRRSYVWLLASVGVTWTTSYLVYPSLYQPVKFSGAALPLVILMVVGDNLPSTVRALRDRWDPPATVRGLLVGLGGAAAGTYLGYPLLDSTVQAGLSPDVSRMLFGSVIASPLVVVVVLDGLPGLETPVRGSLLGVGLLMLLMFYPHCFTDCSLYGEKERPLSYYRGLFDRLRSTPKTTTVVGPPHLMDPVPAFAGRSVYFHQEYSNVPFICDRIRTFAPIYYASSPPAILRYMREHDLQYLVVDRRDFRTYSFYSCGIRFEERPDPVLDRPFPNATWSRDGEVYLLSRNQLERALAVEGEA